MIWPVNPWNAKNAAVFAFHSPSHSAFILNVVLRHAQVFLKKKHNDGGTVASGSW